MNTLKVVQRDNGKMGYERDFDPWGTLADIWQVVFPGMEIPDFPHHAAERVVVEVIADARFGRRGPLQGIGLRSGSYGDKLRRRVMLNKQGEIDLDALKAKFEECKAHAEKDAEQQRRAAEISRQASALEMSVRAQLQGYPESNRNRDDVDVWADTPTTVMVHSARVTGTQLAEIERIIGHPYTVEIRVRVPADQAVAIYNVLKPVAKGVGQ